MIGPLTGFRVIEICNVASGPYCGMLLADMGADVIKIENPAGGDGMRAWPPIKDGYSENFASLNRNKRSVTLNLKDSNDREEAIRLIKTANILIENNRPGVMKRLGLDYSSINHIHPALIYGSISAFGQDGPRSEQGGFDLTLQAMSGIMEVTGEPGSVPVKSGVPISDFATGLYAAFAICAYLQSNESSRTGVHLDISMLGSSLAIAALQTSQYFGTGKDPVKMGSAHPRNAPYQAFRTADGYIALAAGNDTLWRSTCLALDQQHLLLDGRFRTTASRARHQTTLKEILESLFSERTTEDLVSLFESYGVPCSRINTYSEALADPQVAHMGWVQPLTLPNDVVTQTFVSPIRVDGETASIYRPPPALGEHNDELLGRLSVTSMDDRGLDG